MKASTWILLANSARATILQDQGADKPLTVIRDMRHPESRKHARDLVTDRPSRSQSPTGSSAALAPHTDPHRNSLEHFAAEISKWLDGSRRHNQFSHLIVVASNPFHGVLLSQLNSQVKKSS